MEQEKRQSIKHIRYDNYELKPTFNGLGVEEYRSMIAKAQVLFEFEDYKVQVGKYPIYRKKQEKMDAPSRSYKTLIFIAGTANFQSNIKNNDMRSRGLMAFLTGDSQIILVTHLLAPENKYPKTINSAESQIAQLLSSPDKYSIDVEKVIISGYSSGATHTIPITISLKRKGFKIMSIVPICPLLDYSSTLFNTPSLQKWKIYEQKDIHLTQQYVQFMTKLHYETPEQVFQPRFSPYFTSIQDLRELPPIHFFIGQFDGVRRQLQAFREKLDQAGANYDVVIFPESFHLVLNMTTRAITFDKPEKIATLREQKIKGLKLVAKKINQIWKSSEE